MFNFQEIFGISFALLSTASWACCTLLLKKFGEKLEPVGMTTLKTFLSFMFLFLTAILLKTDIIIDTKALIPVALSGIIGIAIGDSLFFASLNRLSPIIVSVIFFVFPDLFSGIFGLIFLHEMPSVFSWIGIFFVILGLGFLIFPPEKNESNIKTTYVGLIFAILSVICTATSMVIIKPVLSDISVITATMYRMLFSFLTLLLYGLFFKRISDWVKPVADKKYFISVSVTFCLATFGGFMLSLLAIKYCKLIVASTLMSLEPLFILLFMVLFCKYRPACKQYFAVLTIISGIIFMIIG